MPGSHVQRELSRGEALQLLSSVPMGRVVFTRHALPAIRPVSHIVEDGRIVFRTGTESPLSASMRSGAETVLAFEADVIDPQDHTGWAVVAVGGSRRVDDPAAVSHYQRVLPSLDDGGDDELIAIQADLVSGYRMMAAGASMSSS
ncbi:MAG: pyridoxamine 5'-phosphate oxidase family protein [Streptosporangiaceae bacterium]